MADRKGDVPRYGSKAYKRKAGADGREGDAKQSKVSFDDRGRYNFAHKGAGNSSSSGATREEQRRKEEEEMQMALQRSMEVTHRCNWADADDEPAKPRAREGRDGREKRGDTSTVNIDETVETASKEHKARGERKRQRDGEREGGKEPVVVVVSQGSEPLVIDDDDDDAPAMLVGKSNGARCVERQKGEESEDGETASGGGKGRAEGFDKEEYTLGGDEEEDLRRALALSASSSHEPIAIDALAEVEAGPGPEPAARNAVSISGRNEQVEELSEEECLLTSDDDDGQMPSAAAGVLDAGYTLQVLSLHPSIPPSLSLSLSCTHT